MSNKNNELTGCVGISEVGDGVDGGKVGGLDEQVVENKPLYKL